MKEVINEVIKVEKDEECGTTEVTLRIPSFQNFGQRLKQIKHLELEAIEAKPPDPEEIARATDSLYDGVLASMQKKLDALPEGPKREAMKANMEAFKQFLNASDEDVDSNEVDEEEQADQIAEAQVEPEHDLHELCVHIPRGMKWGKTTQAIINRFLADWPEIRPVVLRATYRFYTEIYPELAKIFGDSPGSQFTLPKPSSPEVVAHLFCITSVYLHRDKGIGLAGHCTWDYEHGYGVLIKKKKVCKVGTADEA